MSRIDESQISDLADLFFNLTKALKKRLPNQQMPDRDVLENQIVLAVILLQDKLIEGRMDQIEFGIWQVDRLADFVQMASQISRENRVFSTVANVE